MWWYTLNWYFIEERIKIMIIPIAGNDWETWIDQFLSLLRLIALWSGYLIQFLFPSESLQLVKVKFAKGQARWLSRYRHLLSKLMTWVQSPESISWKQKNNSQKLCFDLHKYPLIHVLSHTYYTNKLMNKCKNIPKRQLVQDDISNRKDETPSDSSCPDHIL